MVDILPLDLVTDCPWFSGLPDPALRGLAAAASIRPYARGAHVYSTGEVTSDLYCVVTGRLRLELCSSGGQDFAVTDLRHGFWFGESALAYDRPQETTAVALTAADVLVLPRQAVLDAADLHPQLYRNLFRLEVSSTRQLYRLLGGVLFYPLRARVASRLLQFAREYGVADGGETRIDIRITQYDLASLAQGSRQRVNQVLRSFTEAGLIETRGDRVIIRDLRGLEDELGPT